jgi:hypothetical protein
MKPSAVGKLAFLVPHHRRRTAGDLLQSDGKVAVAIGAREDDDRGLHFLLHPLDPEILDDVVGEQFAAHAFKVGIGGPIVHVQLDQLSGANVVDARKAEPLERVVNGLSLRVENAGFESDEDAGFHGRAYGFSSIAAASFTIRLPLRRILRASRNLFGRTARDWQC